ncbi:MAG: hypothetical protein OIF36_00685 [Alphaproteobacteria bacterium]|nr:hypothetical protein [Alphaproteobacteria bacterium]
MTDSDFQLTRMVHSLKEWFYNEESLITEMSYLAIVNPALVKIIQKSEKEGRYNLGTTEKVMKNIRPALSRKNFQKITEELSIN